jgi:hypothetical protein
MRPILLGDAVYSGCLDIFTYTTMQGSPLYLIFLIKVQHLLLKLYIVQNKVIFALIWFREYPVRGIHMIRVSITFFKLGNEGFEILKVHIVISYEVDH